MGVRGLTTFIAKDSDRFLKRTILRDTTLVIDGNCIASHLYKWFTKRDSAFGGDYDEYMVIVKKFFLCLKKCNIVPIVIFDGGYEERKIKTVFSRLKTKLMTLKNSFKKFSKTKYFPLFMKQVFWDAVESLKIKLIQTEFEADAEIAKLARSLRCPVLSYDSDFYIYDVLYIPFSTVELEAVTIEETPKTIFGLQCSLYDVNEFLKEYPGLMKSHLPLIATVLGNDFIDTYAFNKFFNQIPLPKKKAVTFTEKKIVGLLNWLRHESDKSAVSKIVMHLSKKDRENVLNSIEMMNQIYKCDNVEEKLCQVRLEGFNLSDNLIALIQNCKVPSYVIDMLSLNVYFTPIVIEQSLEASTHTSSVPIIQAIYSFLVLNSNVQNALKVYVRRAKSYKMVSMDIDPDLEYLNLECLSNDKIPKVLKMNDFDIDVITKFPPDSHLFILCFLYWCKSDTPTSSHAHALLLCYIACQAKHMVGLCKVGKDANFTSTEMTEFNSLMMAYRKTTESARETYDINVVHIYNSFQSIIYHISALNALLGYPFNYCKIADFFCGTLIYNLHANLAHRNDIVKYLKSFLRPQSLLDLYMELYERVFRYFPIETVPPLINTKRKKKKKSKKISLLLDEVVAKESSEEGEEYDDLANKFYQLRT